MKSVDCDVIKDLFPSYIDKLSSDSTNNLIEKHLQTCKDCNMELHKMKREINPEYEFNQDEQIDYLKGYNKNKIRTIIFSIVLTLNILFSIFISLFIFDKNAEFFVDVDELDIVCSQEAKVDEKELLTFYLFDQKYNLKLSENEVVEGNGDKTIHLKVVGKYPLFNNKNGRHYRSFRIDETIKKIYVEDKKGNLREIWNKDMKTIEEQ